MLSWNDEDVFSKKSPLGKSGSLPRSLAGPMTAQRTGFLRRPVDVAESTTSRKSNDSAGSPPSSLPKAGSLLRGPGNAPEGTIGSDGWWHHMDHSQMNEPPADDSKKLESKTPGFAPQFGVTGQSRSLWADEPAAAQPVVAPVLPAYSASSTFAAATPAEPAPAPASKAAVEPAPGGVPVPTPEAAPVPPSLQDGEATGCAFDKPAEEAPLAARDVRQQGEHVVMGGGYAPQLTAADGMRYGSIFAGQMDIDQRETGDAQAVEEQVAKWGPFEQGQQGCAQANAAATDDDWTGFASAPRVA